MALYKRKTLNMWVGSSFAFLDIARWKEQAEPIDLAALKGQPCIAAFDLSKTRDFTALVLLFEERINEEQFKYRVLPFFWLPEEGLEKRQEIDGNPYPTWIEREHLELSPGPTIDYHLLVNKLKALAQTYKITEVCYDPAFAEHTVQDLDRAGFKVSAFRQNYLHMTIPLQELQRLVLNRQLVHGNNPILAWQAQQLQVRTNEGGGLMPSRKNRNAKIDGVVALTMALGTAMRHHNTPPKRDKSALERFMAA